MVVNQHFLFSVHCELWHWLISIGLWVTFSLPVMVRGDSAPNCFPVFPVKENMLDHESGGFYGFIALPSLYMGMWPGFYENCRRNVMERWGNKTVENEELLIWSYPQSSLSGRSCCSFCVVASKPKGLAGDSSAPGARDAGRSLSIWHWVIQLHLSA